MKLKLSTFKDPSLRSLFRKFRLVFEFKYPPQIAKFSLFLRTIHVNSIEGMILKKIRTDHSEILSIFADKYAARRYVSNRVGEQYLSKLLGVYSKSEDIPWSSLPNEFVLKCSHASGGIVIVSSKANLNSHPTKFDYKNWKKYLIHPRDFNPGSVEKFFSEMLSQNYAEYTDYFEFAYSKIEPFVLVEELLKDENGNIPKDYKFWCFNGKVALIQIDSDRYSNHLRDFYDRDWNKLNVQASYPNSPQCLKRPKNLDNMIHLSEKLSSGSDLLRVDLYDLDNRIIFGELTNYPGGGVEKFRPRSFSKSLYSLQRTNRHIE